MIVTFCPPHSATGVLVLSSIEVYEPSLKGGSAGAPAAGLRKSMLFAEPFPLTQTIQFGVDNRTRILLFAENLGLLSGEGAGVVTAEAEDANRIRHALVCRAR